MIPEMITSHTFILQLNKCQYANPIILRVGHLKISVDMISFHRNLGSRQTSTFENLSISIEVTKFTYESLESSQQVEVLPLPSACIKTKERFSVLRFGIGPQGIHLSFTLCYARN